MGESSPEAARQGSVPHVCTMMRCGSASSQSVGRCEQRQERADTQRAGGGVQDRGERPS